MRASGLPPTQARSPTPWADWAFIVFELRGVRHLKLLPHNRSKARCCGARRGPAPQRCMSSAGELLVDELAVVMGVLPANAATAAALAASCDAP